MPRTFDRNDAGDRRIHEEEEEPLTLLQDDPEEAACFRLPLLLLQQPGQSWMETWKLEACESACPPTPRQQPPTAQADVCVKVDTVCKQTQETQKHLASLPELDYRVEKPETNKRNKKKKNTSHTFNWQLAEELDRFAYGQTEKDSDDLDYTGKMTAGQKKSIRMHRLLMKAKDINHQDCPAGR